MTVPILPDPPSRSDPASFPTRADDWNAALQAFSTECNVLGATLDSSVATVTAGLSATLWASGSYSTGAIAISPATSLLYRAKTTGTKSTDPSADTTNWELMTVSAPTLVVNSTTTKTAERGTHVEMTNVAASAVTLPAGAVGDWVWIGFSNALITNTIIPNGTDKIMGVADTFVIDTPYAALILRYISAGFGWRVFK
jgi:hypothetical protein